MRLQPLRQPRVSILPAGRGLMWSQHTTEVVSVRLGPCTSISCTGPKTDTTILSVDELTPIPICVHEANKVYITSLARTKYTVCVQLAMSQ